MIVTAVALLVVVQAPKTFEELELAKIQTFHELKSFHEELEITVPGSSFTRVTTKDGARRHVKITTSSVGEVEDVSDGVTVWSIYHAGKIYFEALLPRFDIKKRRLQVEKDSFRFTLDAGLPVQFDADPEFTIKSIETKGEGKDKLREVTATAVSRKGRPLKVVQWFLPETWILKRFTIEGEGEDGPFSAKGEAKVLDLNAKLEANEFAAPAVLKEYKRKEAGG